MKASVQRLRWKGIVDPKALRLIGVSALPQPVLIVITVPADVVDAAVVEGATVAAFAGSLIDMGLECWRDDRGLPAGQRETRS